MARPKTPFWLSLLADTICVYVAAGAFWWGEHEWRSGDTFWSLLIASSGALLLGRATKGWA